MLYPEYPDTFWSFKHALKFVRKRAAMLPREWDKRLIGLNASRLAIFGHHIRCCIEALAR